MGIFGVARNIVSDFKINRQAAMFKKEGCDRIQKFANKKGDKVVLGFKKEFSDGFSRSFAAMSDGREITGLRYKTYVPGPWYKKRINASFQTKKGRDMVLRSSSSYYDGSVTKYGKQPAVIMSDTVKFRDGKIIDVKYGKKEAENLPADFLSKFFS